jgi:hypothetical protein
MPKYIKNRILGGYGLNLVAVVSISTLVLVLEHYHPYKHRFSPGNGAHLLPAGPTGGGVAVFSR